MILQIFPSTGSLIPVTIEDTQLTSETLNNVFSEAGVEVSNNMVVTFGFRTPEGAINRGTFDENTALSADVITLSISMRETKAASSDVDEIVEIAKQALISGVHKDLITTCYILFRHNNGQFKGIIGNYTNKSFAELQKAITEVLEILAPAVEVSNDVLELINKIDFKVQTVMEAVQGFETRIQYLENKPSSNNSEVELLRSDLAYVANHFKIALPNHSDLFENY